MLGSSIIGFHTQFHRNNFLDSVDRYLPPESRIDREEHAVIPKGNTRRWCVRIRFHWSGR